jgi:hypothetical protein
VASSTAASPRCLAAATSERVLSLS